MLLKSGNRNAGYADGSWKAKGSPKGTSTLEIYEDKMRRLSVPIHIPMGGLTREGCEWEAGFIAKFTDTPALYLEWDPSALPAYHAYGKASVLNGLSYSEPQTPCSPRKAAMAICHVMQVVTERSEEQLKEENLSGVHVFRHVGAVVTILADWPEQEGNVVGDWSSQKTRAEGATAARRAKGVASSVRGTYAPDVCASKQTAIRKRYVEMMREAFSLVRADQPVGSGFPREISWEELFPTPPPLSLVPFYGPLYLTW